MTPEHTILPTAKTLFGRLCSNLASQVHLLGGAEVSLKTLKQKIIWHRNFARLKKAPKIQHTATNIQNEILSFARQQNNEEFFLLILMFNQGISKMRHFTQLF